MKKTLTVLIFLLSLCVSGVSAGTPHSETLQYKVLFKWGIIHKQAGTATFNISTRGEYHNATVIGRSAGWADKFYKLRDTLSTRMRISDLAPVRYERIAHEGGSYARDLLTFSHSGNTVSAISQRWRRKKGSSETSTASSRLTATGFTVDLLSSFYYLRALPFGTMAPGKTIRINIFSGKRKELLTIIYSGTSFVKINNKTYQTYKVRFTFTSDGKKETSDPIEAWISTEPSHIPLKLAGKLKVGQIQCIYTGKI